MLLGQLFWRGKQGKNSANIFKKHEEFQSQKKINWWKKVFKYLKLAEKSRNSRQQNPQHLDFKIRKKKKAKNGTG